MSNKRPKMDHHSPNSYQTPLALPGTSWKGASIGSNSTVQYSGAHRVGASHSELPTPPDDNRPSASGSGSGMNASKAQTDFDTLNDAVGMSGVDIAAEEELARQQTKMYGRAGGRSNQSQSQHPWPTPQQRVKIMDFLDKPALTVMVQHIAASYQLKTLEPAILDVLTQAAEHRIHSLLVDAIAAKNHRISSSHLRPPPLYPSSSPKGKQKEKEREAMYDQVIYDDPERILSILARVEGEEERKARIERELNQTAVEPIQELSAGAGADPSQPTPSTGPELGRLQLPPDQPTNLNDKPNSSNLATSLNQANALKKEKKRKREGPGQQAKNMSEDARARQSNQTAMRSVGGRAKYSWLSGGTVNPTGARTSTTAIMASLPAPKFAPQTKGSNTGATNGKLNANEEYGIGKRTNNNRKDSSRLGGILPGTTILNHTNATIQEQMESEKISLKDCLFGLERERGSGAGRGSGSRTLFKTYLVGKP